jgi:hypothetical protein
MLPEVTEINLLTGTRVLEDNTKDCEIHIRGPNKKIPCKTEPRFPITLSLYPGHFKCIHFIQFKLIFKVDTRIVIEYQRYSCPFTCLEACSGMDVKF